jgi:hypothetical protein
LEFFLLAYFNKRPEHPGGEAEPQFSASGFHPNKGLWRLPTRFSFISVASLRPFASFAPLR